MNSRTLQKLGVMMAAFAIAAGVALAGQVTFPSTFPFTAGTPIRAAEVNAALTAVKTAVDDNHARVSTLETNVAALTTRGLTLPSTASLAASSPSAIGLSITAATGKTAVKGLGGNYGLVGDTLDATGAGILAANSAGNGGAALELSGGLKVSGSGRPAFTHVATASNSFENFTCLNNPLTNNRPTAIVMVTQNFNPGGGAAGVYNNNPIGVYYGNNPGNPLSSNKWCVFNQRTTESIPVNAAFNILVINQ
jgi:hypothetical protein